MRSPTTSTSRLVANGIWNTAASVVAGVVSFFLVPFLLHRLGQELYGVWILIGSMFAYSTIFHFGLASAINRFVPLGLARGEEDMVKRVTTTGAAFFGVVALAMVALTLVVRLGLTDWFHVPTEYRPAARQAVLVVGLLISADLLFETFGAVLSGYQRYDLTAGSRILMSLARATGIGLAVRGGGGLVAVAAVYGVTELGVNLGQFFFARRLLPPHAVSPAHFDVGLLREMLTYGANTFLYGTGAVIAYKASELVIGAFMRPDDVARYSVAASGVLVITALIESMSAALKPAVSDLDARREATKIRELSLATQKYTLLLIVPATAFLMILGRSFLGLWTGLADPEIPIVLAMLALAQAFRLSQHSNFLVLVGMGEHRFFGLAVLLVGALTVGSSVLAAGVLHLGLVGIAGANLLSWAVVCGAVVPAHVNARLGITLRERWAQVLRPVGLGCAPCVSLLLVARWLRPPASWPGLALLVALIVSVTLVSGWRWALVAGERRRFYDLLRLERIGVPRSVTGLAS